MSDAMKLTYVAGPYRGKVRRNIRIADRVGREIAENGDFPIVPHNNTRRWEKKTNLQHHDYIVGDLLILSRCDAIVMLPKWQESEGAKVEHSMARYWGLPVYYYPDIGGDEK